MSGGRLSLADNSTNILGTKSDWELRASSISTIAEEWNSVATVGSTRESMGLLSVDCPFHS